LDDEVAVCVDAGTTMIKAVVLDATGREVLVTRRPTTVHRPGPGRSEQDMEQVWTAVADALREAVERAGRPVRLLALTAQGDGAWTVDAAGDPVRPAVLWNDARGAAVVERWQADGVLDEAFRIGGSLGNAGLPHAVLEVLADEEPDVLARADAVLTCGSWLLLRLTGVRGLDPSDASAPWLDLATGDYSDALLDLYGARRHARLLPPLLGPGEVHPLTDDAAARTGLPAGLPVVLAPYDVVATALGTGATTPGSAVSVLGTTLCTETLVAQADTTGEPGGLTLQLGRPGLLVRAFPTLAGAGVLDWTAELLGLPDAAAVCELAEQAPPGSDGLRVLPYLSPAGERAPFLATAASGLFAGVTFDHGRAHVARAVLEGLAHVVRDCLDAAPQAPRELRLCGGGAASDLWCTTIADVAGVPVLRSADSEVGAKGALVAAAVALGEHPDLTAAADALVRPRDRFEPDPERRDAHDAAHAEFLATRDAVRPRWPQWRAGSAASVSSSTPGADRG
jgi:xylulokinase